MQYTILIDRFKTGYKDLGDDRYGSNMVELPESYDYIVLTAPNLESAIVRLNSLLYKKRKYEWQEKFKVTRKTLGNVTHKRSPIMVGSIIYDEYNFDEVNLIVQKDTTSKFKATGEFSTEIKTGY